MRVFISQASRDAAHNLNDLSERWQLRHEKQGVEFRVPDKLPPLRDIKDALLYKVELYHVFESIKAERARAKRDSEKEALLLQMTRVSELQMALKAVLHDLGREEQQKKSWDFDKTWEKHVRFQARKFGHLVSIGEAELSLHESEAVVYFPKQNITVRIPIDKEQS